MKVNRFGMLIKFAIFYLCMSAVVLSAIPLESEQQNVDKEKSLATTTSNEDYDEVTKEKTSSSTSDTKPPFIFPSDDDKSTSKNETALEILQKNSAVAVEISTTKEEEATKEVEDSSVANKSNENENKEKDYDEHSEVKKGNEDEKKVDEDHKDNVKNEKEKDYDDNENEEEEKDVENIQESQDQGNIEETYGLNSTIINVFEEPTLKNGHIALIFASSLIILSASAYVGLILWRKSLEHRYSMRQRLVTEDDYYNNNDVRFFGL